MLIIFRFSFQASEMDEEHSEDGEENDGLEEDEDDEVGD